MRLAFLEKDTQLSVVFKIIVRLQANQGDIGAMCSLGDYYRQKQDFEEAAKWYDMGAQRDVVYAAHMAVKVHSIIAISALQIVNKVEYV